MKATDQPATTIPRTVPGPHRGVMSTPSAPAVDSNELGTVNSNSHLDLGRAQCRNAQFHSMMRSTPWLRAPVSSSTQIQKTIGTDRSPRIRSEMDMGQRRPSILSGPASQPQSWSAPSDNFALTTYQDVLQATHNGHPNQAAVP